MKKTLSYAHRLIAIVLVLCCFFATSVPAFAASNEPYGYTYDDASTGRTMYKYYSYSGSSYKATRTFYSDGNKVYTSGGTLITSASAGAGSRYNGFGTNGNFYAITSKGELLCVTSDSKVSTLLSSGAEKLTYNNDDLATKVSTSSGSKDLSTMKESTPSTTPPSTTPAAGKGDRVAIYTNSANEMVYDAYNGSTVKVSIVVSENGKHILNNTNGIRLSDTLKGVKFMGIDSHYNVYMYEDNGTLYRFVYGNWYSAEKITLNGNFKKYTVDDRGFVVSFVTDKDSLDVGDDDETSGDKWVAKKTYAVTKDSYVTLYVKGTSASYTLLLKDNVLTLNGVTVTKNVSAFGFVSAKEFTFIKDGKAYTGSISNPTDYEVFCSSAMAYNRNEVGLTTKVVLTSGKTKSLI